MLDVFEARMRAQNLDPSTLSDSTDLAQLGVVDSMGFLELVTDLEQRTGSEFDFSEADPDDFSSVGGLLKILIP